MKDFKRFLRLKDLSERTINQYVGRIKKMKEKFGEFTKENIDNYILNLKENYSKETINAYINAISNYLEFKGKDIKLPKRTRPDRKLPSVITKDYFENEIIPTAKVIFQKKTKVISILYFLFYTGIRIGELETIKREDIDLEKRTAKIYMDKSGEERKVVFTKDVRDLLRLYFSIEPEEKNAFNISTGGAKGIFKKLDEWIRDKHIYPHLFRHSYATHLLDKGIDVSYVSKLLGHKNIQTTMRYLNIDIKTLKRKYDEKIK